MKKKKDESVEEKQFGEEAGRRLNDGPETNPKSRSRSTSSSESSVTSAKKCDEIDVCDETENGRVTVGVNRGCDGVTSDKRVKKLEIKASLDPPGINALNFFFFVTDALTYELVFAKASLPSSSLYNGPSCLRLCSTH
jgi:hypothetical protein